MTDTALLVIDMQQGVVDGELQASRLLTVVENLNLAIDKARQLGYPIIFVQHEDDDLRRDSAEWQLYPALKTADSDLHVYKRYGDSFLDTNLAGILTDRRIKNLWIGGCATDFCVDSTVRGAVSRNYQVTVIGDAHTTVSAFSLSGEQVIDHFNSVWGATSATPKPLRVVRALDL